MGARPEQLDFAGAAVEIGDDPEVPDGKWCSRCRQVKPASEFHRSSFTKNGIQGLCKTCTAANSRRWMLKKRYGLTEEQRDEMLASQDGRCAACGTDDPGAKHGRFQVDHDHRTGIVRALLCNGCNNALGGVDDSIERLLLLVTYLQEHSSVET